MKWPDYDSTVREPESRFLAVPALFDFEELGLDFA